MNGVIAPSAIHGLGLFASRTIHVGEEIEQGEADFENFRELWIRYNRTAKKKSFAFVQGYCMLNHSETPNTHREGERIVASIKISKGTEITEDYNALPDEENPFKNTLENLLFDIKNNPYK